jgi:hypothetical protein
MEREESQPAGDVNRILLGVVAVLRGFVRNLVDMYKCIKQDAQDGEDQ